LISALRHKEPKVRVAAAEGFGRGNQGIKDKKAIPALIEALDDPSSAELRRTAAASLGEQGLEAKAAVPALLRALEDKDVDVRLNAAGALARIDPREAKSAIPMLTRSLGGWERENQGTALGPLQRFGADGVTELIRSLQHPDRKYRLGAAKALAGF